MIDYKWNWTHILQEERILWRC